MSASSFVGRAVELAALHELVDGARLVTLVGPGGCGKTRLARELLRTAGPEVVVVELARIVDADQVEPAVLAATGGRDVIGQDAVARIVDHLAGRPTLLVLDNCEHLVERVAAVVDALLAQLPELRVVTTSRESLGVAGEAVYRVPPLSLPADEARFAQAQSTDAVLLFLDRASRVRPDYPFADEGAAVVEICRRLDGLPLAIELAAARLSVLSPTLIAAGLDDRFRLLTGGTRVSRPRHQTLQACVQWSYALLTSEEQHLLDLLSVFRGGCTLDAVAAVADGLTAEVVFDVMDRLEQKSLVVAEPRPADTRFHVLETISQFAGARLAARGEVEAARRRHLDHFLAFVGDHGATRTGDDPSRHLVALHQEQANIEAALELAFDLCAGGGGGDAAASLWALVGGLTFFWSTTGRFGEARRWFDRCLLSTDVSLAIQMPARWGAAHIALYGGDFDFGLTAATEAIELAQRVGDARHEARALNSLGTVELFYDAVAGLGKEERAILLAEEVGDEWCLADALQVVGYTLLFRGDFEGACTRLDRARPIAERLDHPLLLAWDRIGQALVAVYRGDLAAARAVFADARVQTERTNDPNLSMNLLIAEAWTGYLGGDGAAWVDRFEAELHDCARIGAGEAAPLMAPHAVAMLIGTGAVERAVAVLDAHLDVILGFTPAIAPRALHVAALAALAGGDPEQARVRIDEAQASLGPLGTEAQVASLDVTGALVAVRGGDVGRAEAAVVKALPVLAGAGLVPLLIDAFDVLAVVLVAKGAPVDAARAAGASASLRRESGVAWSELEVFTSAAVAPLADGGDAEVRAAFDEGLGATVDDAIAYASRARGARQRPSLGWDSLTPTELQVSELVAEGLTNGQVASRLFVSAETVKTHLSHVYTKLDLSNRAALASAFTRRPSTD